MPLNAQRFFLTYSQVGDASKEALLDFLSTTHQHFDWAEVAAEHHQDGGRHLHAVVIFRQRIQRNTNAFDWAGFHPNIVVIRNGGKQLHNRRRYIRKEDENPVSSPSAPEYTEEEERRPWGEILRTSTTQEEFLSGIEENYPKDFILRYDQIFSFAQRRFNAPSAYINEYPDDSWDVPAEVTDWVENVLREVSV